MVPIDGHDFIRNLAIKLDKDDIVIDDFLGQQAYLAKYYYHEVLGLKSEIPDDYFNMNDVEDLPTFNMKYEFMALYNLYKIGEKWGMSWPDWMNQPIADVEYQIELGRRDEQRRIAAEEKSARNKGKSAEETIQHMDQTSNLTDFSGYDPSQIPFKKNF